MHFVRCLLNYEHSIGMNDTSMHSHYFWGKKRIVSLRDF